MIFILSQNISPRLGYTAEILFRHLLLKDYTLLTLSQKDQIGNKSPVINYTDTEIPGTITIPDSGFLHPSGWKPDEPKLHFQQGWPFLFPTEHQLSFHNYIPFDLFAASFFFLSGYEYYQATQFDEHGRYQEASLFSIKHELHKEPWVHHYAQLLKTKLSQQFPDFPIPDSPGFDYEITFDIDRPWLFQNKNILQNGAGLLKNLASGERGKLERRWQTMTGQEPDPFDSYDNIETHCKPDKTRFFFLMRKGKLDNPFTPYNKAFQNLIKRFADAGYQMGIHPSYEAAEDRYLLWAEQFMLEHQTGQDVIAGRQHFLRHWLPMTPHHYLEAGIEHDYGACFVTEGGFKYGMAQPFPWYDLQAETPTNLYLHPTMVMDRTLQQYLALPPEEGKAYVQNLIEKTRKARGKFVILLHNESLSDFGEWSGWRRPLLEIIDQLQDS